jgi:hypothetical protein
VVVTTAAIAVSEVSRSFKCKQVGSGSRVGFAIASGILPFFALRMKAGYQHTNAMASIVAK